VHGTEAPAIALKKHMEKRIVKLLVNHNSTFNDNLPEEEKAKREKKKKSKNKNKKQKN